MLTSILVQISYNTLFVENVKCYTSEFLCQTENKCIPRSWVCDGNPDCKDGADEQISAGCGMFTFIAVILCFQKLFSRYIIILYR